MTTYRLATIDDAFDLMRVHQLDEQSPADDRNLIRLNALKGQIADPSSIWIVSERGGKPEGFAWLQVDREQRLAKIRTAAVNPDLPEGRERSVESLVAEALRILKTPEAGVDILYTTMRPLAYSHDVLRSLDFRALGIFPNGKTIDNSVVNSLAAYFFEGALAKRQTNFALHPLLQPLYEIAREECGLGGLPTAEQTTQPMGPCQAGPLPTLEVITAPNFVANRFERLKSRHFLSMQFYPFHEPNTLITDPNQMIEIFVRTFPDNGVGTVIGERLDLDVDPVALFRTVSELLRSRGVSYIEVINDAADIPGTSALIDSGYLPCAYFPGLKRQGQSRRDYVVFARSFENFIYPNLERVGKAYVSYLEQFYGIEKRTYHRYMKGP